ncbi:MAG: hypothetical protein Q8O67_00135 [Deltaproteobacteria bacterium]|nr:hypothetical protein [Deltaproteobacteria bacterium]
MRSPRFVVVALAVIAGLSVPAQAQTALQLQQQAAQAAGGGVKPFPLHANISLTHNVGSGTFVATPFNPTVSSQLTLAPFIAWEGFNISLSQTLGMEWTQSDSTTYGNQVEMSDIGLRVGYNKFAFADLNLVIIPSVSYQVPISLASRQAGSLGTPNLGVRAIYSLPDHGFSFYASGSTGFTFLVPALSQRFANQQPKEFEDDLGNKVTPASCITRTPAELLNYACGGLPSAFRWSTGLGGSWTGLDNQLSLSLDLGYGQGYSVYFSPDDQFTADRAVPGAGLRQSTSGNLSATYIPTSWFFLTLGFSSFQGAFQENGTTPRFPLWDFVSPYNNFSSVYVDTTFSF